MLDRNLVILSAEIDTATFSGNRQRSENLKACLEDLNLEYMESKGYFEGNEEQSFVVIVNNDAEYEAVRDLGLKSFDQEFILHQHEGSSFLVYPEGHPKVGKLYIGRLTEVNPKETEQLENFTIVNNRVFTTIKS